MQVCCGLYKLSDGVAAGVKLGLVEGCGTNLKAAFQPLHKYRKGHICVGWDNFKHPKWVSSSCCCIQGHEQSAVNTAAMCFLHSQELCFVILLNIV